MKKFNEKVSKKVALIILTAVTAFSVMGCSAEKTEPTTEAEVEEAVVEDTTVEETTEEVEGVGDVIEDTDLAIFDNNVFSFSYDPANFNVVEAEGSVTVSYINEDVQTAGANTITFTELVNSDAMEVVKGYLEIYEASEDEMVENYLGGDDVKGYSYSTGVVSHEGSDLKTCQTVHAVPCGDSVILIDKLRTYGDDMDLENSLDAQLDEVILTFKITAGATASTSVAGTYSNTYTEEMDGSEIEITETVVLKDDNTCEVTFQDTISGTWSEDTITLDDGSSFEYNVEGDTLNLNRDGVWVAFSK